MSWWSPWIVGGWVLFGAVGAAATDVPATLGENTQWVLADSPYRVTQDVRVIEGVTLTIDAGVAVELDEGCSLYVEGALVARGTPERPIGFAGAEGARWGSLVFEDSSVDAVYEGVDDYQDGSVLEHCRVEGGSAAVQLLGASPLIRQCEFVGNRVDDPQDDVGGAALRVMDGSAPRIVGCRFEANEVADVGWGGAIYAHAAAPVVQDNVFEGNVSSYGGGLCFHSCHSPIVGNEFRGNTASGEGGAISLYSSSPALLDNVLDGNTSMIADGGGVHVCVDCRPHANPIVIDNDIVDNEALFHGAGGIGAAYLRVFRYNTVVGNTLQGEPSELGWFNDVLDAYPEWVTHPDVSRNWWGTTDLDDIEDAVFHGADDPAYGVAQLEPALDQARDGPSPWAAITTREIRYKSDDQQMPVYLTLYNPDEARDVVLVAVVQYGERVRLPWSGPLELPGAEPVAGGHRLTLPAGGVMFAELMAPYFSGEIGLGSGTWHAFLFDAGTGEPLSEGLSARFAIGEGE